MRRPSGENSAVRTAVMARKYGELSARGRVPDARGLVVGGGDDAPPVGRERGAAHVSALVVGGKALAMAGEDRELHAAGRIPDTRSPVVGGSNDAPPVGENATLRTIPSWPESPVIRLSVAASQMRANWSPERMRWRCAARRANTRRRNVIAKIGQYGELHAAGRVPDVRRSSKEAVTMRRPSGENAALGRFRDGRRVRRAAWPCPRPRFAPSVVGGGDDAPPIGRERGRQDHVAMT